MPAYSSVILLLEGNIVVRHRLAEYLRNCHFEVVEAENGDEAMQLLDMLKMKIDLVLANTAARESGRSLAKRIRTGHPAVGVIFAGPIKERAENAGSLVNEEPPLATPYVYHLVLQRLQQNLQLRLAEDLLATAI